MNLQSVTIIGLGTLGGYTAEAVADIEGIEKIVILDHDVVEQKNLRNSIYRQIDIDIPKALALKEILLSKNLNVQIRASQVKYEEGITKLPKTDLVIDCRDVTYSRQDIIDARFYISSRYLIGDFRKQVVYDQEQTGKYLTKLTKNDLKYAASIISMLVYSGTIKSLIKKESVQKYELDFIKRLQEDSKDIIYEDSEESNKFINLQDKIIPILDANKKQPITLFVGSKTNPLDELTIPINTFNTSHDIITRFLDIIKNQSDFNNFIVALNQEKRKNYIELIPETGAA